MADAQLTGKQEAYKYGILDKETARILGIHKLDCVI